MTTRMLLHNFVLATFVLGPFPLSGGHHSSGHHRSHHNSRQSPLALWSCPRGHPPGRTLRVAAVFTEKEMSEGRQLAFKVRIILICLLCHAKRRRNSSLFPAETSSFEQTSFGILSGLSSSHSFTYADREGKKVQKLFPHLFPQGLLRERGSSFEEEKVEPTNKSRLNIQGKEERRKRDWSAATVDLRGKLLHTLQMTQ